MNRGLAAFAVAVLIVTLWLLGFMRQRFKEDLEQSVRNARGLFVTEEIMHGPGGNSLVHFGVVERMAAMASEFAYIEQAVVTVLRPSGEEAPVVPYDLKARRGESWHRQMSGSDWRREPVGQPTFGYLYLQLDRSALQAVNLAIGTVGLALILVLVSLLARIWGQETSLTRTMIELNERRRELIRLERLALAGQLSAGLLHDLRKPVLHIQHSLEDLNEALGDFAPAAASLQDLRHHTRLFFQMLADSQIERLVRSERATEEYVNVVQIVECALNLVRYERRGVEVIRRDGEGLPAIVAHPFRLVQLFSNLALNAYQAMDGRGELIVESAAQAGGVAVRFTDNGPGMAPDVLKKVFDPFFTTKAEGEGTGLGLSICRMIAEEAGGTISAQSRPGGPTTFEVWLPTERPPEAVRA